MTFAPPQPRRAFTLIEVLLAVSVFAIVLAAINSVFFGALRLRNRTIESFETARPLNHALRTIQRDLEGIMPPGGRFSGKFTTTLEGLNTNITTLIGERVTPDIHTATGPVNELARWADVQKVAYYLVLPTNTTTASTTNPGRELVRQVTRNILSLNIEEPEAQWLLSGVETFRLYYYDGMAWNETWDSSVNTNLPTAIKVQLTMSDDYVGSVRQEPAPIEIVVPILVKAASSSETEEEESE